VEHPSFPARPCSAARTASFPVDRDLRPEVTGSSRSSIPRPQRTKKRRDNPFAHYNTASSRHRRSSAQQPSWCLSLSCRAPAPRLHETDKTGPDRGQRESTVASEASKKRRRQNRKQKHLESSLVPGSADEKKKPPTSQHPASRSGPDLRPPQAVLPTTQLTTCQFLSVAQRFPRRTALGLDKV
jgi:hypothetical protein